MKPRPLAGSGHLCDPKPVLSLPCWTDFLSLTAVTEYDLEGSCSACPLPQCSRIEGKEKIRVGKRKRVAEVNELLAQHKRLTGELTNWAMVAAKHIRGSNVHIEQCLANVFGARSLCAIDIRFVEYLTLRRLKMCSPLALGDDFARWVGEHHGLLHIGWGARDTAVQLAGFPAKAEDHIASRQMSRSLDAGQVLEKQFHHDESLQFDFFSIRQ